MPTSPGDLPNIAALFTEPLDRARLPYMVVGGVASIGYGMPRTTEDVDIVLALPVGAIARLLAVFPEEEFYRPYAETLIEEVTRPEGGHFNIYHHDSGLRADVYLSAAKPLARWAMTRRRQMPFEGVPVWFAPPEYVIVHKLEFFRMSNSPKQRLDVQAMLAITPVDRAIVEAEVARRGLEPQWQECQPPPGV